MGEHNAGVVKLAVETKLAKINNHVGYFFVNKDIIIGGGVPVVVGVGRVRRISPVFVQNLFKLCGGYTIADLPQFKRKICDLLFQYRCFCFAAKDYLWYNINVTF